MKKWEKSFWIGMTVFPLLCFGNPSLSFVSPIGKNSFELTRQLVDIGPRPPGSPGIVKVRTWLETKIKEQGFSPLRQPFMAVTPLGMKEMVNLFYPIPGKVHTVEVLLVAHYDSKPLKEFSFIGANDAASSVALLLALSPEIKKKKFPFDVKILFVDGEEAQVRWTETDSLYGSREFVKHMDRTKPFHACLVVDMISDTDLQLIRSAGVDPRLMSLVEKILSQKGWNSLLEKETRWVEDDHLPFLKAGIPTLHLMDFTFGGKTSPGEYWHTPLDNLSRVSLVSLSVVGEIILGVLEGLPLH